ncbi:MAG: GtrA family protein [Alicyclobacillus sp.]|nr:GtrA family protein [Alicyclobacillus sp.]
MVVGLANAAVDLLVLNGLLLMHVTRSPWLLSLYNTVAVICAILNSYIWNRRWTFADTSDGSMRERFAFVVQAVLNIVLNDVILVWLSSYLVFAKSVPLFISSNAAKGLAMFLASSVSFIMMRLFVFRRKSGS